MIAQSHCGNSAVLVLHLRHRPVAGPRQICTVADVSRVRSLLAIRMGNRQLFTPATLGVLLYRRQFSSMRQARSCLGPMEEL